MSSVIIGSVNCRGLAEKIKRGDIFPICKERYYITVLADTHCCLENESHWLGEWGYIGKFSSYSSRSRGVAVLYKNSFEFKINSEILDTDGNFVSGQTVQAWQSQAILVSDWSISKNLLL
jgi:hypothetical protein